MTGQTTNLAEDIQGMEVAGVEEEDPLGRGMQAVDAPPQRRLVRQTVRGVGRNLAHHTRQRHLGSCAQARMRMGGMDGHAVTGRKMWVPVPLHLFVRHSRAVSAPETGAARTAMAAKSRAKALGRTVAAPQPAEFGSTPLKRNDNKGKGGGKGWIKGGFTVATSFGSSHDALAE